MPRTTNNTAEALPYRPVDPLPPSDTTQWRPVPNMKAAYSLGSKAMVWETIRGWRWRIIKLGGEQGLAGTREAAMRATEFILGLGEMEVVEK